MKLIDLPNISTKRLQALQESGIEKPIDLLYFFPRRYLDRTNITPIRSLRGVGEEVTAVGEVTKIREEGYKRNKRLEVYIKDETAYLKGVWFRGGSYIKRAFAEGDRVAFFGEVKRYGRYLSMAHPDFEKLQRENDLNKLANIFPIYPSTKALTNTRINSTMIRKWVGRLIKYVNLIEYLPESLLRDLELPERLEAMQMIHFPQEPDEYRLALYRFKFDEFFLFELAMARLKKLNIERSQGAVLAESKPHTSQFFNDVLPFELTGGQKQALSDIKRDVRSGRQMNRLIQGDVGSGKTIVAMGALLMAIDSGYQGALMAPTEILAEQHFHTLRTYLEPLGITVRLLVGSQKKALREDILSDIAGGSCDIVVGTHAIIQDAVQFNALGMVVIDEQHRFGVAQRAEILQKGAHPHILVMSATPIPRSLAMTLYSDLDISLIKELPAGRKPIKTAVRYEKNREQVYTFVGETLEEGGQAYIVYPLVEESEALDLKNATDGYEKLKARYPEYKLGLLHGQMKSEEKDAVMRRFADGELHILISTTVIEVGVDVPNANLMLVEHAERFGLSQLHQLRGRIGRGSRQSYCILMAGQKLSDEGRQRLQTMERTNSGFEIAEEDLKMRGPGDFLGTKQSGLPDFRVADIVEDQPILEEAKRRAFRLLDEDPELSDPDHQLLGKVLERYIEEKSKFFTML